MSLVVSRRDGEWAVSDFAPQGPATRLSVPSEGGPPPASAPPHAWLMAVAAVAALTAGAELVLRALRPDTRSARAR